MQLYRKSFHPFSHIILRIHRALFPKLLPEWWPLWRNKWQCPMRLHTRLYRRPLWREWVQTIWPKGFYFLWNLWSLKSYDNCSNIKKKVIDNFFVLFKGVCQPKYCKNGGNCYVDDGGNPMCSCPDGFVGDQCELGTLLSLRRCAECLQTE